MKKSVVIVEDDRGLRGQLIQILESAPDLKFLGAFTSAEEALPQILAKNPDVVLMDIKLPGMSGNPMRRRDQKSRARPCKSSWSTVYEDSERIFRALKAGANVTSSNPVRRNNCWPRSATFPRVARRCPATSPAKW
ncbi:MAG: response regulator transcription factor [Limisphaerales bacterium]